MLRETEHTIRGWKEKGWDTIAVICRDELRATLTMRLTALGTEVLNPQDGGTGLTVQIRLRGGASAVM